MKRTIYFNTTSHYPIDVLIKYTGYIENLEDAIKLKYEDQTTYKITIECKKVKI